MTNYIHKIEYDEMKELMIVRRFSPITSREKDYIVVKIVTVAQVDGPFFIELNEVGTFSTQSLTRDMYESYMSEGHAFYHVADQTPNGTVWLQVPPIADPTKETHYEYIKMVVINGESVTVGDKVGDYKVAEIIREEEVLGNHVRTIFMFLTESEMVFSQTVVFDTNYSLTYGFEEISKSDLTENPGTGTV